MALTFRVVYFLAMEYLDPSRLWPQLCPIEF